MDLERIKTILELPGGPAFAAADGEIVCATAEAGALGLGPGRRLSEFLEIYENGTKTWHYLPAEGWVRN